MAFIKIKNLGSAKYLIKRIKRQATDWEEIFAVPESTSPRKINREKTEEKKSKNSVLLVCDIVK